MSCINWNTTFWNIPRNYNKHVHTNTQIRQMSIICTSQQQKTKRKKNTHTNIHVYISKETTGTRNVTSQLTNSMTNADDLTVDLIPNLSNQWSISDTANVEVTRKNQKHTHACAHLQTLSDTHTLSNKVKHKHKHSWLNKSITHANTQSQSHTHMQNVRQGQ